MKRYVVPYSIFLSFLLTLHFVFFLFEPLVNLILIIPSVIPFIPMIQIPVFVTTMLVSLYSLKYKESSVTSSAIGAIVIAWVLMAYILSVSVEILFLIIFLSYGIGLLLGGLVGNVVSRDINNKKLKRKILQR